MRTLGIDPGSRYTGYGVIERRGSRLLHVTSGRLSVINEGSLGERLVAIYEGLREVIAAHAPEGAAIEGIFHQRNAASALTLGHARGVALLACAHSALEVGEYAPTVIKKAVTGTGRADKEQVQRMVRVMLTLGDVEMSLDESDALAIAICHAHMCAPEQRKRARR